MHVRSHIIAIIGTATTSNKLEKHTPQHMCLVHTTPPRSRKCLPQCTKVRAVRSSGKYHRMCVKWKGGSVSDATLQIYFKSLETRKHTGEEVRLRDEQWRGVVEVFSRWVATTRFGSMSTPIIWRLLGAGLNHDRIRSVYSYI